MGEENNKPLVRTWYRENVDPMYATGMAIAIALAAFVCYVNAHVAEGMAKAAFLGAITAAPGLIGLGAGTSVAVAVNSRGRALFSPSAVLLALAGIACLVTMWYGNDPSQFKDLAVEPVVIGSVTGLIALAGSFIKAGRRDAE